MAHFRFIHASDLHLAQVPDRLNAYDQPDGGQLSALMRHLFSPQIVHLHKLSSYNLDIAMAFCDFVADHAQQLHGVIITGDIATTGSRADLAAARDYFYGRFVEEWEARCPELSRSLVRSLGLDRLMIMPGNHDRYGDMPTYFPESKAFEALFGWRWNFSDGARDDDHHHHRWVRTTALMDGATALAVCRADFSLTDRNQADLAPFCYMGQGRVCSQGDGGGPLTALGELVEQTRAFRRRCGADAAVIWCIHFPPAHPAITRPLRLIDDGHLLAAARELGIELILSGHTHALACYLVNGGATKVICCGSTTCTSHTHGNVFLDLTVDTDNLCDPTIKVYQWDTSTARNGFVEVPWGVAVRAPRDAPICGVTP